MIKSSKKLSRAAFLDRDGVINEARNINTPNEMQLLSGVGEAIHRLNEAGYLVLVVTNQAGVAFGHITEKTLHKIHGKMRDELQRHDANLDAIAYCCEHPGARIRKYRKHSRRRKPGDGMFRELIQTHNVDPERSFMVGDRDTDITPARLLGMTTYYIGADGKDDGGADHRLSSLSKVVDAVLMT